MPIPIHEEKDPELKKYEQEHCCICRDRTTWWTSLPNRKLGQQVAICPHCASRGDPKDVPTKKVWWRREEIALHPTIGDIARGHDKVYPPAPVVVPNE